MIKSLKFLTGLSFVFILTSGCSENRNGRPLDPAGLGPQGVQLRPIVKPAGAEKSETPAEQKFKTVLITGQKAIAWLNLVNLHRDLTTRLNLADLTTKNPVPPDKPNVISIAKIIEKYNSSLDELPSEMKPFLVSTENLIETPPVPDEVFLTHIRAINKTYQQALRWIAHEQYHDFYAGQNVYDIRGYYFLIKEQNLNQKLKDFDQLDTDTKASYQNWLAGLCHNSKIEITICSNELSTAISQHTIANYYKKYLPQAKITYENFFKVKAIRQDLKWDSARKQLTQDFIEPTIAKVANWLQTNIEQEWKALDFQLKLNFVPKNDFSPYVQFVAGVTPHVSGAHLESITMDPDYSLDDYSTQWTIRHEFGHVLGFPDCYLEFYDIPTESMTYYTIEPDNLMCAWGGKLQPSHIEQLKKMY